MRRHTQQWLAAALLAFLVAGGLAGCSREAQIRAQEAAREAPDQVREAARRAEPWSRRVAGKVAESADDLAVAAKVKSALLLHKRLKGARIDVGVEDGVVLLKGTVRSREQKALAAAVARDIRGVRRVESELTVRKDAGRRKANGSRRPANSG